MNNNHNISKDEYQKAAEIVKKYEQQHLYGCMGFICVCCQKESIKNQENYDIDYRNPIQGVYNDGAVFQMNAGFGSKFDLDSFLGGICDSCIHDLLKKQYLLSKKEWDDKIQKG